MNESSNIFSKQPIFFEPIFQIEQIVTKIEFKSEINPEKNKCFDISNWKMYILILVWNLYCENAALYDKFWYSKLHFPQNSIDEFEMLYIENSYIIPFDMYIEIYVLYYRLPYNVHNNANNNWLRKMKGLKNHLDFFFILNIKFLYSFSNVIQSINQLLLFWKIFGFIKIKSKPNAIQTIYRIKYGFASVATLFRYFFIKHFIDPYKFNMNLHLEYCFVRGYVVLKCCLSCKTWIVNPCVLLIKIDHFVSGNDKFCYIDCIVAIFYNFFLFNVEGLLKNIINWIYEKIYHRQSFYDGNM